MNSLSTQGSDAEISAAAADWFVRLHEEDATEHDFQQWQHWLAASPEHERAYQQIVDGWHLIGEVTPAPWASAQELDADREQVQAVPSGAALGRSAFRRKAAFFFAIAATILAAVGIAVAPKYLGKSSDGYSTVTAEQRSVRLPDGSRVTLGARSTVMPMFDGAERRIVLKSGEAYFEVTHDPNRPFVVIAGGKAVRAVGTAFNVHAAGDRMLVGVVEGRVAIITLASGGGSPGRDSQGVEAGQRLLSSGQEALLTSVGGYEVQAKSPEEIATWRNGRFEYRGEELRHVVDDLNRYTDRRIVLDDDRAGSLRYSGTVFPDHLDEWLEGIAGALPIQLRETAATRHIASIP